MCRHRKHCKWWCQMQQHWLRQYRSRFLNLVLSKFDVVWALGPWGGGPFRPAEACFSKNNFKSAKNLSWDNVTLFLQDCKGIRSIYDNLNGFSSDTWWKWTRNYLFEFTFVIFNNLRISYAEEKLPISVQKFCNRILKISWEQQQSRK